MKFVYLAVAGALLLGACGAGEQSTVPKEVLRFQSASPPTAYLGESYRYDIVVTGGVTPYQVRLRGGKLPAGLRLDGTTISGTPTEKGRFEFTLSVTDASLSSQVQALSISAEERPPATLSLSLPSAEVSSETRIPLRLANPRLVQSARATWKVPEGFRIIRVQPGSGKPLMLWAVKDGTLTLDMGFTEAPKDRADVAFITVRPDKPGRLRGSSIEFQVRDIDGKVLGEQGNPMGTQPAQPAPGTPGAAPGTPAPATSPTGTPATAPTTAPATPSTAPATPATAPATPPPPSDETPPPPSGDETPPPTDPAPADPESTDEAPTGPAPENPPPPTNPENSTP
ncbi:hypothetical protein HNR42_000182 [Deinobacterium chartae]|uniref:Uncharacterized protein n=1 Tax=Deinobacterium chartae TaxID=521158 RepID=A0A841HX44_9DEIO|nr:Ig domain-containing protein [Deinobacterium chartae]MBB6096770.1 hypothetical protein [Deinobacterium chartae]